MSSASASVNIVFPASFAKVLLSITKLYADMTNEGNMHFKADGLYMGGIDQSHVCFLKTVLSKDMIESMSGKYEFHGDDEQTFTAGIPYKVLSKIIGAFPSIKMISMSMGQECDTMSVTIESDSGNSRFEFKLMDIDQEPVELPDMDYNINANILTKDIQKVISQAEALEAETIDFVCDSDTKELRIQYKTDIVNADVLIHKEPVIEDDDCHDTSVAALYPKRFFAAGQVSSHVYLSYSSELPVRFKCDYCDGDEIGFTEMYIAPRLREYEDEDDEMNYRE